MAQYKSSMYAMKGVFVVFCSIAHRAVRLAVRSGRIGLFFRNSGSIAERLYTIQEYSELRLAANKGFGGATQSSLSLHILDYTPLRKMGQLSTMHGIALVSGSFLSGMWILECDCLQGSILTPSLGAMMSLSFITVPVLLSNSLSTAQLCAIWADMYIRGRSLLPTLAVGTLAFYILAYARQQKPKRSKALILAGATTIAIAPFTWVFLAPTNTQLFGMYNESQQATASASEVGPAQDLIAVWSLLHIVRSLLPLFGAMIGLYASG
jgi:hypothetical protein